MYSKGNVKNYIQYHNTEKMGHTACDVLKNEGFFVMTKKDIHDILGQRIWLVSGEGKNPRRFYLSAVFIADNITGLSDKHFFFKIRWKKFTKT